MDKRKRGTSFDRGIADEDKATGWESNISSDTALPDDNMPLHPADSSRSRKRVKLTSGTGGNSSTVDGAAVLVPMGSATTSRVAQNTDARVDTSVASRVGTNISARDYDDNAALSPIDNLCIAIARHHHVYLFEFLERYPTRPENKTVPLHELLKQRGSHGATVVYVAAKYSNITALKELIRYGADVNIPNTSGVTPLYIAGHYGNLRAVSILCSAGADVERAKSDGATVTYSACKHGHLDVVKRLVMFGASAHSSRKRNGMTLLHVASQNGHTALVEYLITVLKADPNQRTITGGTALHLACFQSRLEVVNLLINRGADVDIKDEAGGWTALHIATQVGNVEIVKAVLHAPAVSKLSPPQYHRRWLPGVCAALSDEQVPPHFATHDKWFNVVSHRLHRVKDDGYSALMVSCRTGKNLHLTKYLISQGADWCQHLSEGSTPFLVAAKHGRLDHVRYFISQFKTSATSQCSQHGWTALHWAARGGQVAMVKLLLGASVDVDQAVHSGMTPLYIASHHGHLEVVKELIAGKANVNTSMVNGASPLYTACKHGQLEVVKYLIKHGASLAITNSRGSSPLHTACNHNHVDVLKYLVSEAGADPSSTKGQQGWMALHIACRVGSLEIVRFLVDHAKVDVTMKTEDFRGMMGGYAALHLAASHGRMSVVRYLVGEVGADIDILSSSSITPMDLAQRRGRDDVKIWFEHAREWNPLMFAVDDRNVRRIVDILRSAAPSGGDGWLDVRQTTPTFRDNAIVLALTDDTNGTVTPENNEDAAALCAKAATNHPLVSVDTLRQVLGVPRQTASDAGDGVQGPASSRAPTNNIITANDDDDVVRPRLPWKPYVSLVHELVIEGAKPYYPGNHHLYPESVRRAAVTVLGVNQRRRQLPKEVWIHVLSFLGRNYESN